MGLLRRVESRGEHASGGELEGEALGRTPRAGSGKKARLYLHPSELARKLEREMEAHKVSYPDRQSVCSRYTVYLCPEDYERLEPRLDELAVKLARRLAKRVREKKYEVFGEIEVLFVLETDLELGHFGILAERAQPARLTGSRPVSALTRGPAPLVRGPDAESRAGGRTAALETCPGSTRVIAEAEAARLGLARRTIVLKAGDRVREFTRGRVILGRAKDVDFRIDDPNVSRRHAVIYWADGDLVVEDLDSTNGTMVNGYPVTSTVLKPGDVLVIGECRLTVETR